MPLELGGGRRERRRRGGPRTPLPLVPLIAVCAGVGIAYVSQTAHGTQTTYQAAGLTAERDALRRENDQLADELGRQRSAERIVSAAQRLGMRPAGQWLYVASPPVPVIAPPRQLTGQSTPDNGSAMGRLISALRGSFTSRDGRPSP
ncbi:MAG: hypothetical protein ABR532_07530 [Candidatus Dormibacteria bacterium]